MQNLVFLDFETTGLNPTQRVTRQGKKRTINNYILEVGIVDANGAVMVDQLVKPPPDRPDWKSAQKKNGISPDMVASAPAFDDILNDVVAAIEGRNVGVYNAKFDLQFMPPAMKKAPDSFVCVMTMYRSHRNLFTGYALEDACEWCGAPQAALHRAATDAQATRHVWNALGTDAGSNFVALAQASVHNPFKRKRRSYAAFR